MKTWIFLVLLGLAQPMSGGSAPVPGNSKASGPAGTFQKAEAPRPVLRESEIHEQDLILERSLLTPLEFAPPSAVAPVERTPVPGRAAPSETALEQFEEPSAPLPGGVPERAALEFPPRAPTEPGERTHEGSLLAQLTPDMPPRGAASLRLAEEGRRLLQAEEYPSALSRLEKAIALDSRNPYAYYYLALAHFHLSQYQQSLNFLEMVKLFLSDKPGWLSRVYALEGENYRALGFFDRADRKYLDALTVDPLNRVALDGLTHFPEETKLVY